MIKKITIFALTALMALVMAVPAMAEHFTGGSDWYVTFTQDKKMESNFTSASMSDTMSNIQPGDDVTFKVAVQNDYNGKIYWYMSNKVVQSLEDASNNKDTSGGAYTYKLVYTNNAGKQTTLFDSNTVGGEMTETEIKEVGEGLHEATNALEDYFLLDTMDTKGLSGVVELYVELDGETQNNNYQDTLAALQLNFAVEVESELQTTTPAKPPKTGDTNNTFIYFVIIGIAGVLLLAAAILRVVAGKKREER